MDNANLSYFMRKLEPEIVEYPAPPSFPEGTPDLKFRVLSDKEQTEIRKHWEKRKVAKTDKGVPFVQNGTLVHDIEFDSENYTNELIATSLVTPNLADKELREFYNCTNFIDMPRMVFAAKGDWKYIVEAFDIIHGFREDPKKKFSEDIDKAKN